MNDDLPWDWDPLHVGDQVRVRLSHECPGREFNPVTQRRVERPVPHLPSDDGREGVVTYVWLPGEWHTRHTVQVTIPGGGNQLYARAELERGRRS